MDFLSSPLIQTSLHETAEVGTQVVQLVAVDMDTGDAGRISYTLVSGNVGGAFTLDPETGVLRVARRLERHDVHPEYTLVVRASDHAEQPLSTTVPVHVQVRP